ncbi:radical SAM family heme chaperone HemW [Pontibacter sp. BT310]|uniref:Heme chaperone HemW n=1 Tax=Pontibacter populi TaxID=890055 RepID=A0ABS6X975_9BACT|nr:radical SAM family heme chaperone HemW [Pontibacter populi]MBJ6117721.1 radical SAM family heme chaperone HemW [Pontibacter sp. BT310]MBR0570147.1 radical SAM family heme chaperone HemW [Microvirga sp. STS03]MBW3364573.1 radical SAM family heme chaperone HemW [Pontibacter populi]
MAGIYLHIPFCKQACHYCDFHFSTSMGHKTATIDAIALELELRRDYLQGQTIETIYFGGGTPSLLTQDELQLLLQTIKDLFIVSATAEISLEANPDDLKPEKLQELKAAGINRLSIGLQSFHEPHLRMMNRAHNATESLKCVKDAQAAGFDNITVDLIYGIPAPDHSIWLKDLETLFSLNVQHVSCYALTIEPDTALGRWSKKGKFTPSEDDFTAQQFETLLEQMAQHGFVQYEISNFCKPGYESKHNSNYWRGVHYLGVGPSAHSFNGHSRQYNVANNRKYTEAISQLIIPTEIEQLTLGDQANDYLLTTLRTIWGCDLAHMRDNYRHDVQASHNIYLQELQHKELATIKDNVLYLTDKGKLLADQITLDLFAE